jgi:hypothetical protein
VARGVRRAACGGGPRLRLISILDSRFSIVACGEGDARDKFSAGDFSRFVHRIPFPARRQAPALRISRRAGGNPKSKIQDAPDYYPASRFEATSQVMDFRALKLTRRQRTTGVPAEIQNRKSKIQNAQAYSSSSTFQ